MMVLTECSEDNSRKNNFVMNLPTAMIGTNVDEKLDQWMPSDKSRPSLVDKHVYDYSNRQDALKTPMCMVAELARHNKVFFDLFIDSSFSF
jgi:hypothetical protein